MTGGEGEFEWLRFRGEEGKEERGRTMDDSEKEQTMKVRLTRRTRRFKTDSPVRHDDVRVNHTSRDVPGGDGEACSVFGEFKGLS